MLKLTGAFLLLAGLGWMGWSAARELARRTILLEELVAALERMERELTFRLTPLPRLCRWLGGDATRPLKDFFFACADSAEDGDRPFQEGWRQAACTLEGHLERPAVDCLVELGRGLGRCDSEGESRLLEAALIRLRELLHHSREESRRRGRLYSALGLTAGAFLVILLL